MKRLLLVLILLSALSSAAASSLLYGSRSAVIRNTPGEIPVREEEPPAVEETQDVTEDEREPEQPPEEIESDIVSPIDIVEPESLPEEEELATPSDLKNKGKILSDVIAESDPPSDGEPTVLQGQSQNESELDVQQETPEKPVEGEGNS